MTFNTEYFKNLRNYHSEVTSYHKELRNFFQNTDVRLACAEYGASLKCVMGSEIFTNHFGFHLYDYTSSPFYLWLPSWFGRCYVDPNFIPSGVPIGKCQAQHVKYMAFVWSWMGVDDAFLKDAEEPECWFGVAEPDPENPSDTLYDVAKTLFYGFRSERTLQGEFDGWLRGSFYKSVECNFNGNWFLRKVPMSKLSSFYQIESLIVRPVLEKYYELTMNSSVKTEVESQSIEILSNWTNLFSGGKLT